jgi:hypothetical protein
LIQSKKIFWLPVMWPDAKSSAPPCYYWLPSFSSQTNHRSRA